MAVKEILDGGLETQDPSDRRVYRFNWDRFNLGANALIETVAYVIEILKPSTGDATLEKDSEGVEAGSRTTILRLHGGVVGTLARIHCLIVTNESPEQRKERSFLLKIEQK